MKINELINFRPTIEKIARKEMTSFAAFEFAKFTRSVLTAIQDFDTKRAELFKKYGEVVDDKGNIKIKPENEKKFNTAIKKLLDFEPDIEPFEIALLNIEISPVELVNTIGLFK